MSMWSGIADYVQETWKRRYFWVAMAKYDLHARYHGSVLGIGWSLLHPIAMTAVLCVIFRFVFNVSLRTYAPFVLTGMAAWTFISACFFEGCNSLRQAERYMRVYPAPIAIYSLRTLCYLFFHFLLVMGVSIGTTWVLLGLDNLATLPLLIPALVLLLVFGWAVIILFGIIDIYFPDNKHLLQVVMQMLFYTVPVLYPPGTFRNPTIQALIYYNPFSAFISLIRAPIVDAAVPDLACWLIASTATLCALVLACILIHRTEKYLVFQL